MSAATSLSPSAIDCIPTARQILSRGVPLPLGAHLQPLSAIPDTRGDLTEVFRAEWRLGLRPVQWNLVRSGANVLRGVHTHRSHVDYLLTIAGEMILCLHDLRPKSPTLGSSLLFRLPSEDLHLAVIPAGVAHGFYFPAPACTMYGLSSYFDGSDEYGCRWNAPELGIAWPCTDPILSDRDRGAGSYSGMISELGL